MSRLTDVGLDVAVEPGAGEAAGFTDEDYQNTGVTVAAGTAAGAGVVLSVQPLEVHRVGELAPNAITVSFLPAAQELDLVRALRDAGHTALALELVPRISRAQAMDALSSQAFVAGYRAGLRRAGGRGGRGAQPRR